MKRIRYLSQKVHLQILDDYKKRLPNGDFQFTLRQIAEKHEVSLSTVNNLARMANCQCRPHGGRKLQVPGVRTMQILRALTEPGITFEEAGKRFPHWVTIKGKRVLKPLTKQRVKQIHDFWKKRGNPGLKVRGFQPGDVIEWGGKKFTVVRYDNDREGAVRREDGVVIDPFLWVRGATRAKRVVA
jgi:hypothetical protein